MFHNIDFGLLIKKSWKITWGNKWLWVYGLIIATLGGSSGSGSGGGGSSSSGSSSTKIPDFKKIPEKLPEDTQKVLGAATDAITQWFNQVPITTWILIGLIIFVVIVIGIIVTTIARSWATAGLIAAFAEASSGKPVTLASTSKYGLSSWKNLLIYWIISGLIIIGVLLFDLILILPAIILLSSAPVIGIIWLILSIFIAVILFFVAILTVSITTVFAERLVVLHNFSSWDAWKKGLSLAKKYYLSTAVMGIINSSISCGVGCASLIIMLVILISLGIFGFGGFTFISNPNQSILTQIPLLYFVNYGLMTVIVLVWMTSLTNAIFIVWKYGTWNEYFKEIVKLEHNMI